MNSKSQRNLSQLKCKNTRATLHFFSLKVRFNKSISFSFTKHLASVNKAAAAVRQIPSKRLCLKILCEIITKYLLSWFCRHNVRMEFFSWKMLIDFNSLGWEESIGIFKCSFKFHQIVNHSNQKTFPAINFAPLNCLFNDFTRDSIILNGSEDGWPITINNLRMDRPEKTKIISISGELLMRENLKMNSEKA